MHETRRQVSRKPRETFATEKNFCLRLSDPEMLSRVFLLLWIILSIQVQADEFVFEYFLHKSASRVTAFSCDQTEDDFRFVRRMNELGIYAAVTHPSSKSWNVSSANIARKDSRHVGLFLDTRCLSPDANEKVIAQTTKNRMYAGIHLWLILASNFDEAIRLLNDDTYSLLTDLAIAVESTFGYELYDVYNPCKVRDGSLNVTELGYWRHDDGLNITLTQMKVRRRSNLHGMKLNVVTVVKYKPPGMDVKEYLEDLKTKSSDPLSKYGWGIARIIADLYNYTMHIEEVDEWLTSVNGTEQGMMALLDRAEADIGISPSSGILRYAAKPYARMLTPGYPYRSFFIFRSNEVKSFKWMELMTPFAFASWYAIVITAIFSIMIITTIQVTEYQEGWFAETGHAIFATLGVLSQQGLTFVPNRLAGRIAFLFLLFFGVLLSNYYGASVVSARLNEPQDKMNDSLYMLAKSDITVASEPFRYIDFNLEYRAEFDWEVRYFLEKVWSKLPDTKYIEPKEGLKNVARGGYAYHTSPEVAYPYVEENWDDKAICEMTEVHVIDPRMLVFWERVDSPFTELTKIGLIQTAMTGLRRRTIKRWKPKEPYCSPDARSLESITFFDIAPAVIIVIIGAILAGTICLFEGVMYRLHPEDTAGKPQKKPRLGGKKALIRVKKANIGLASQ